MMKIAVIFESSPFDRKGLFNAVHERIRHLQKTGDHSIDVFCVHSRDNAFTRHARHTPKTPYVDSVEIEGIRYDLKWYRFSILDHILFDRLHRRPLLFRRLKRRTVESLSGYDVLIGHSFVGSYLAYEAHCRYGTAFFANWHGSDVHTHPWRVPVLLDDTRKVMEAAVCNFFVSEALLDFSERITRNAEKKVLYNGVSEKFVRFDEPVRDEVRRKFGVGQDAKSVSFAGNLSAVKNVRCLAPLFRMVSDRYDGQLKFFIAGDGKLRHCVEADMREYGVDVRFMGNLPAEDMPSFMNATDVLVLPSLNEGLPLVCAEALRCGANVAGSKVGGIPEIISPDFTVPLGSDFIETLAGLIVRMLEGGVVQEVPEEMDWSVTALKEQRALDRLEFPRKP